MYRHTSHVAHMESSHELRFTKMVSVRLYVKWSLKLLFERFHPTRSTIKSSGKNSAFLKPKASDWLCRLKISMQLGEVLLRKVIEKQYKRSNTESNWQHKSAKIRWQQQPSNQYKGNWKKKRSWISIRTRTCGSNWQWYGYINSDQCSHAVMST